MANIEDSRHIFDIQENHFSVYGQLFYFIEEILSNNTKMTQSYRTVTKTREMNTEYDNSLPHQDRTHYSSQNHRPTRYIDNISQLSQFKNTLTERPLGIAPW